MSGLSPTRRPVDPVGRSQADDGPRLYVTLKATYQSA
jgi:hypothetical protein